MKKVLIRAFAVAAVVALAWLGYRFVRQLPQRQRDVATTRVRRGDVVVRAFSRGELRAVRSMTLTAPNLFGTVQVTRLAPLGSFARSGDLVVEFDDAAVQSRLEEKGLELEQTDERIKKSEADLAIRNNQDEVDLLKARYSVRRAELEVQRNELLSVIDAKKNELNLTEAEQRLEKLKSDIESRRAQAEAQLAVLQETKNKAVLELQREKLRLRQVKLLAPMSGLVAIRQARTHFFFAGTQMPDIREGDEVRPGMAMADILDLSELEVSARVGELDRANLKEGQEVLIRLDALAEKVIHGKIKNLSGTASADIYSNDPAKKFDVTFEIDMRELLTTLGAKPDQIDRIMVTAEQNRKKAPTQSSRSMSVMMAAMKAGAPGDSASAMMGGSVGGMMGGASSAMMGGGPGGFEAGQAESGGQRSAGGRRSGGSGNLDPSRLLSRLPEDQRKKAQEALDKELKGKKWEDLSQDEKQKAFQKIRPFLRSGQSGSRSGTSKAEGQSGAQAGAGAQPSAGGELSAAGGKSGRDSRGDASGSGRSSSFKFTDAQLAAAKLPVPPEQEGSQLDILMRPGLLADVEIIVENIPNAIYIPVQAVHEKDNKPMVYVQSDGRFEERIIQPLKRSESMMVVAEGLKEGEIIALANPYAKPGETKQQASPSAGGGSPMGGLGGGGGGGGRGGRGR